MDFWGGRRTALNPVLWRKIRKKYEKKNMYRGHCDSRVREKHKTRAQRPPEGPIPSRRLSHLYPDTGRKFSTQISLLLVFMRTPADSRLPFPSCGQPRSWPPCRGPCPPPARVRWNVAQSRTRRNPRSTGFTPYFRLLRGQAELGYQI